MRRGKREPRTLSKRSAGPPGLHDAVGDGGDLEDGCRPARGSRDELSTLLERARTNAPIAVRHEPCSADGAHASGGTIHTNFQIYLNDIASRRRRAGLVKALPVGSSPCAEPPGCARDEARRPPRVLPLPRPRGALAGEHHPPRSARGASGTTGARSSTPGSRGAARLDCRHPDDGRYILTNGYDWTYFTVDDAPYLRAQRCASTPDAVLLAALATARRSRGSPSRRASGRTTPSTRRSRRDARPGALRGEVQPPRAGVAGARARRRAGGGRSADLRCGSALSGSLHALGATRPQRSRG